MNIELDAERMMELYDMVNRYGQDNKMEMIFHEAGEIELSMKVEERHLSSPNTCHGGVIAGMMDSVIGASALSMAFTESNLVSTIEFKINYLQPVHLHDILVGKGRIEFKGKSIIVSSGEIYASNKDKLVAKGIGTFNAYPIEKSHLADAFKM